MGRRLILVFTGRGAESAGVDRKKWAEYDPVYVAENLKDAAKWLCSKAKKEL